MVFDKTFILRSLILAPFIAVNFPANAALVHAEVAGKIRTIDDVTYVNSKPAFLISAGLDRFIELDVIKSGESVVQEYRSSKVGIFDKHETPNGDVYGKLVDLQLSSDGEYTVAYRMLSIDRELVETRTVKVILDSSAPLVGNITWSGNYGRGLSEQGIEIWSPIEAKRIRLDGIADDNPIEKVHFEMLRSRDGSVFASGDMNYFPEDGWAQLGTGSVNSVPRSYFPSEKVDSEIRINVTDLAGNTTTVSKPFHLNGKCISKPLLHAFEVELGGAAILGVANMIKAGDQNAITKNPMSAIFKLPKSEARNSNPIYGGYPVGVSYEWLESDETYSYFLIKNVSLADSGHFFWPDIGITDNYTWRCHPLSVPNPSFSSNALPPVFRGYDAYINDLGWVPNGFSPYVRGATPVPRNTAISQIKLRVDARPYEQKVTFHDGNSCTVAINKTECIASVNWPFNTEGQSGHYHIRPHIYKVGSNLRTPSSYIFKYDGADPIISERVLWDSQLGQLIFDVTELHTGNTWGEVRLLESGVVAYNLTTGEEVTLKGSLVGSGNTSRVTVDLSALKEGEYDITAYALDNAWNRSERSMLDKESFDRTAPTISAKANGKMFVQGQMVKGLESLEIILNDLNESKVDSMQLRGGPGNDHVDLAYVYNSSTSVQVEYPKLFPALVDSERYTVSVVASDQYGNATEQDFVFQYSPNNLVRLDLLTYLPVNVPLLTSDDKPFAEVISNSLRTDNGNLVSGLQEMIVTVRGDSELGVVVAGTPVSVGETKVINFNVENNEGKLNIPIYPLNSQPNLHGAANFMIEILSLQ